jgi:hypothetical protein
VAANDQEKTILETYRARATANVVPVQLVNGARAAAAVIGREGGFFHLRFKSEYFFKKFNK